MSITIADNITNLDTYFGDSSTDRVSEAERFQAITEATVWMLEELGNDHAVKTYALNYLDTVSYYKITTAVSDLLASADLRRGVNDQNRMAQALSSRAVAEKIGQGSTEFAWAIDRKDSDSFIGVTLNSKNRATIVADFDALTAGGGTWVVDDTNSDATNLTVDTVEKQAGSASLNFDADVSQSGNDLATILNTTMNTFDLSAHEDLASWLFEAYVPDVTNFSSFTLTWGSDTSNYWSATVTTDINGTAWANQWNTVKIDWADATKTGSPDVSAIVYMQIDFNYTGSQTDDTDFRVDYLRLVNPEKLTFHYVSWDVGTDTGGTDITAFSATTDVPFYSGKYDQYKYVVAHKAAAILFYSIRLREEAQSEEREAAVTLKRQRETFPVSKVQESHNFKVSGVNFSKRRGRLRNW